MSKTRGTFDGNDGKTIDRWAENFENAAKLYNWNNKSDICEKAAGIGEHVCIYMIINIDTFNDVVRVTGNRYA